MSLETVITDALQRPVPAEIEGMAQHVASLHPGTRAVLAYGSCLRGVSTADSLIDFYVLTEDLTGVSRNALSRLACRFAPPNVYYGERTIGGQLYRCKYAVLPLPLFQRWTTADNPYVWARFAQPSALVQVRDDQARLDTVTAISQAAATMYAEARGLSTASDPLAVWTDGFSATYKTELRPESADRAASIVAANSAYYLAVAQMLDRQPARHANWTKRRLKGKLWTIVRLAKAAFTFSGGADYIVWKIERHSGHKVTLTDWQRRHPIIAGLMLLPQLLKRGAVR